jgi:hypothetical protein
MNTQRRATLIRALRTRSPQMNQCLQQVKKDGMRNGKRPDFVWYFLLQSSATLGNSRGWQGLIGTPANYRRVTWEVLEGLSPTRRLLTLQETLRAAKVRMPDQKASRLDRNFETIVALGGLAAVRRAALGQVGTTAKIRFMQQFAGIGDKYGRNIWMDMYDPDFRQTIAIDERIKTFSRELGVKFRTYDEHEAFYQDVAQEAGIDGWDLDRLLYNFRDDLLRSIKTVAP